MSKKRTDEIVPRGMSLEQAASYFGVSYGTFRTLVARGQAPGPVRIPGVDRNIWYRDVLDAAMDRLRDGAAA